MHGERQPLLVKRLEREELSPCRQVLLLAGCMYILLAVFGMSSALGVIYVDLIREFDTPRAEAALVQSLYIGLAAGGGILFTEVITRLGPGRSVMVSSAIGGIAVFTTSFGTDIIMVIILTGAVAGLAVSVNLLGSFVAISWTFNVNRKAALAVICTGSTIGQTVFPYLASSLIEEYNWRGALMILSGFLLNCIPCALLLYSSNLQPPEHKGMDTHGLETNRKFPCADVLGLAFVLFVIVFFLYNGTGTIEFLFIYDLSILRDIAKDKASLLLSLIGAVGLFGRILGASLLWYLPSVSSTIHLIYSFIIIGIGHFLVVYFLHFSGMLIGDILYGLASGLIIPFLTATQLELRGIDRYPVTAAVCNLASGLGQIAGGFLGGMISDLTGRYDGVFYLAVIASGACALLICVIMCLKRLDERYKSEEPDPGDDTMMSWKYNTANTGDSDKTSAQKRRHTC